MVWCRGREVGAELAAFDIVSPLNVQQCQTILYSALSLCRAETSAIQK